MGLSLILPMANRAVLRSVVTLRHCKLAVQHGVAEGFLLGKHHAPMECQELLALRVLKVGREYWAKWGHAVRAEPVLATVRNDRARAQ